MNKISEHSMEELTEHCGYCLKLMKMDHKLIKNSRSSNFLNVNKEKIENFTHGIYHKACFKQMCIDALIKKAHDLLNNDTN